MNTDRQQIIAKIKKLLAKADDNRGNFNECKLAMSIAMRLMAQYKIEQAELKDKPAEAQKVAERSFKTTKHAREIPYITTIMRDHFQADMAYSNYTAYVYATEDSVDNALYIAEFLYNNMKAALRAEKRKAREHFRLVCEPDFYCGFMSGICSALKKQEMETFAENESYAIICQTELALVDEYVQREVKPKEVHTHNPLKDYESFNRGYERGQNTSINPAIA